jgi:hypothetical protein
LADKAPPNLHEGEDCKEQSLLFEVVANLNFILKIARADKNINTNYDFCY